MHKNMSCYIVYDNVQRARVIHNGRDLSLVSFSPPDFSLCSSLVDPEGDEGHASPLVHTSLPSLHGEHNGTFKVI